MAAARGVVPIRSIAGAITTFCNGEIDDILKRSVSPELRPEKRHSTCNYFFLPDFLAAGFDFLAAFFDVAIVLFFRFDCPRNMSFSGWHSDYVC